MVKKQIDELNKQLEDLKKTHKNKQPTNKVVKLWVGGMKKMIAWWTMSNLTPEERQAKRKKFENASMDLFGADSGRDDDKMPDIFGSSGNKQAPPALFGGSNRNDGDIPSFLDDAAPMKRKNARKTKPNTKRGGKRSTKHIAGQKYVIRNGKAYPIAGEEQKKTKTRPKKRKKAATTKKTRKEEPEDERPMFFDING